MLSIVGTITTTTHVHQTEPRMKGGSAPGNENRTITSRVWCPDGQSRRIPFITANSVRGILRRSATTIVLDAINKPTTRQMFHVLTRGVSGPTEVGSQATVAAMMAAKRNVFAGLFGGGAYMLHSRYSLAPLFPVIGWCERFLHPAMRENMIPWDRLRYRNDKDAIADVRLTTQIILTGKDDLLSGQGEKYVADYQKTLSAYLAEVTAGRVAKATKKAAEEHGEEYSGDDHKAKQIGLDAFNFVEAMLPGTPLQFWLRFVNKPTPAQIGLALMAVRDWANRNVLGGSSARGFGRFEAKLSLYDDSAEIVPNIFNLSDHATAYTLSEGVAEYVKAATAEIAALTLEDLDVVYPVVVKAPKKENKTKDKVKGGNTETVDG